MTQRPIRFLNIEQVLELHADAIREYGGDAGIRDRGLLESAVAQPKSTYGGEYLHADIAEMAAAYVYHLAMNHALVDGNKRIAAYAAGVFLDLNGYSLACDESQYEELILAVARGECAKAGVADFFRAQVRPQADSSR